MLFYARAYVLFIILVIVSLFALPAFAKGSCDFPTSKQGFLAEYKTFSDYKAFALARYGKKKRKSFLTRSYNKLNAGSAVNSAIKLCRKNIDKPNKCQIYMIGDKYVCGDSSSKIKSVVAQYNKNISSKKAAAYKKILLHTPNNGQSINDRLASVSPESAVFSKNARYLASFDYYQGKPNLSVWSVATKAEVLRFSGANYLLQKMVPRKHFAFSEDGQWLALTNKKANQSGSVSIEVTLINVLTAKLRTYNYSKRGGNSNKLETVNDTCGIAFDPVQSRIAICWAQLNKDKKVEHSAINFHGLPGSGTSYSGYMLPHRHKDYSSIMRYVFAEDIQFLKQGESVLFSASVQKIDTYGNNIGSRENEVIIVDIGDGQDVRYSTKGTSEHIFHNFSSYINSNIIIQTIRLGYDTFAFMEGDAAFEFRKGAYASEDTGRKYLGGDGPTIISTSEDQMLVVQGRKYNYFSKTRQDLENLDKQNGPAVFALAYDPGAATFMGLTEEGFVKLPKYKGKTVPAANENSTNSANLPQNDPEFDALQKAIVMAKVGFLAQAQAQMKDIATNSDNIANINILAFLTADKDLTADQVFGLAGPFLHAQASRLARVDGADKAAFIRSLLGYGLGASALGHPDQAAEAIHALDRLAQLLGASGQAEDASRSAALIRAYQDAMDGQYDKAYNALLAADLQKSGITKEILSYDLLFHPFFQDGKKYAFMLGFMDGRTLEKPSSPQAKPAPYTVWATGELRAASSKNGKANSSTSNEPKKDEFYDTNTWEE